MIVFTNIGAKPLELGLGIDRRDRAEASLDRLGGVEAEILAKALRVEFNDLGGPTSAVALCDHQCFTLQRRAGNSVPSLDQMALPPAVGQSPIGAA